MPPKSWAMPYDTFLNERRRRMANVVRAAWERLRGGQPAARVAPTIAELIAGGETEGVEFKSTLRTNLHTGQPDDKIQMAVLKTAAAFLNAGGGTLLIGVADDGVVTGLAAGGFANEDKMSLHLVNLLRDRIGELFLPYERTDAAPAVRYPAVVTANRERRSWKMRKRANNSSSLAPAYLQSETS